MDAVLPKQVVRFHPYLPISAYVRTAHLQETGYGAVHFCVLFFGTTDSFCGPTHNGQEILSKLYLV